MVIIYFFCQQPPPTTRNTAAQMTTRTNTARGASGGPMKPVGATPPPSAAPVKKESTPYKPLPIPPTFDLELDSTQLKEAINKLGYDPHGKIPTSLLVRPKANSSIPGKYWIKIIYIQSKYYKELVFALANEADFVRILTQNWHFPQLYVIYLINFLVQTQQCSEALFCFCFAHENMEKKTLQK